MRMAAALLVLAFACAKNTPPSEPATPPGEVRLTPEQMEKMQLAMAPAEVRDIGGELLTSGRVTFDDLRVSHVVSPVNGRVTAITAQVGQRLEKGAQLARIVSPDLGSALADEAKAQADLIAADHELRRQRELFAAHAGSRRDLEIAEDNERKARAELERARGKARLLHAGDTDRVTQEFVLRAPIAGEVMARTINPGTDVQGQYSGGTAPELFTIGDIDEVWILGDVFEVDLPQVKLGAPVSVTVISYPGRKFAGRVDSITGMLDPVTRTSRIRCAVANPAHELKPEMYVTVGIAVPKQRALAIPRNAVVRIGDQNVVFVQTRRDESGVTGFARRVLKVDETSGGEFVEVKAGLKEGEPVVVSGAILLSGSI